MAIRVTLNDNPVVPDQGVPNSDTVTIGSGFGGGVTAYDIKRRDGQPVNNQYISIRVTSDDGDVANMDDIVSISGGSITLRLDFRTKYRVRVMNQSAATATWGSWSSWTDFKTRDKRYQSPDAITQLSTSDSLDAQATEKNNITITAVNTAKATVAPSSRGATVDYERQVSLGGVGSKHQWQQSKTNVGTTYRRTTSRGETIINVNNDRGN